MCHSCNWVQLVLAALILIFAFWQTVASKWIIVVAAVLILVHSFACPCCKEGSEMWKQKHAKAKPKKKKK